ncbi:MAG: hypothetical protein ACI9QN_001762 [Arcticibacterium sp.]|jgi:uncharacterized protein
MLLVEYGVGLTVNYYETQLIIESNFNFIAYVKANQISDLGRLFTHWGIKDYSCYLSNLVF